MEDASRHDSHEFRLRTAEADIQGLQLYTRGIPERVSAVEAGQADLKGSFNKLIIAIVGFTITVAISAIGIIATIASQSP